MVMVEALAANRAVVLAKELSIFKVVVDGDCLRVIQALNALGRCRTMYGHVIEKIWTPFGTPIQTHFFSF